MGRKDRRCVAKTGAKYDAIYFQNPKSLMIALYVKPAPKVPMCQNPNMGLLECEVSDYKNARAIRPVSHA